MPARDTKRIKTLRRFVDVARATLRDHFEFGDNEDAVVAPLLGNPPAVFPRILYEVGGVVTDENFAGVSINGMTVIMEAWSRNFEDSIRVSDLVIEALDRANLLRGLVGALDEPSQDAATFESVGGLVYKHVSVMTLVVPPPLVE